MRIATRLAVPLAVLAIAYVGCNAENRDDRDGSPGTTRSAEDSARRDLPDLVGKGLQDAQDSAQEAGFHDLTSHDSLGRDRAQLWDRNWRVCFQSPSPGPRPTGTKVDLGAVKKGEDCPPDDHQAPAKAGERMLDFRGTSVKAAQKSLGSKDATVKDASGRDRFIFLESNWKVCGQDPAPGAALKGHKVTLTAVQFDEDCP